MATVTKSYQQMGIAQMVTAGFTSDNAAQIITLGFAPAWVKVINETDTITWEWINGMSATKTVKTTGVPAVTVDTGSAIVDNGDGTITLSATAVGNAKVIKVIAAG